MRRRSRASSSRMASRAFGAMRPRPARRGASPPPEGGGSHVHGFPGLYQTAPRGPGPGLESDERETVDRQRILFVCTANVDRSRTAGTSTARTRATRCSPPGPAPSPHTPVTREMLLWADRVFVMSEREDQHGTLLRLRFPEVERPVVDLDVEDRWRTWRPGAHRTACSSSLTPHLGPPQPRTDR